ncbi:sodium-dependent proline transporter-like [Haliotis asinina]|uniref:sodium-dependent proline transporter-like n=1 Tax=Haliotis asinina TaxID=109174 RepID=UPI003531EA66
MYTISDQPPVSGNPRGRDVYVTDTSSMSSSVYDKDTPKTLSVKSGVSSETMEPRIVYGVDENEERGNWSGRMDFVLSMLGYAVGLGNIWRFPYLCYRNGGGAFLIPFILMLAIVGMPLFFMEVCLGQFTSCGPTTCWNFAPLFKGVGFGMLICSGLVSIYYNVILTYSFFYLFASFTSSLPWTSCGNDWNTDDCSLNHPLTSCKEQGTRYSNGTCYTDGTYSGVWNNSLFTKAGLKRTSPSEEYWNNYVLGLSSGVEDLGSPRWALTLTLLLAWIVVFLCLIKGIKTTGKVVYFTALFPYVVLIILFFRGVTLENAWEGIYFYIVPRWERLADGKVWRDAAVQIFYSMGPGWGGLIALSSYNRFHNNALTDSLIVSLGDSLTSIFGGFVIFSYLGYMAGKLNVSIENVVKSGAGLAFIVYPEAVASLPAPPLWAILFFCMLITLGLDSQFAQVETVLTGTLDLFPHLRARKTFVILIICSAMFLLGLPLVTPGGMYWLQLMDHYAASWSLLVICLTENVAIVYIYGINRFFKDLEIMMGKPPSIWWKICWMGLSPGAIVFIFVFSLIEYSPARYDAYTYPAWAEALGWMMALLSILIIPVVMIYKVNKEDEEDSLIEKLKLLVIPTRSWGPALVKHRKLIKYVQGFVIDPMAEKAKLGFQNPGFDSSSRTNSMSRMSAGASLGNLSRSTAHSNVSYVSHVSFESSV